MKRKGFLVSLIVLLGFVMVVLAGCSNKAGTKTTSGEATKTDVLQKITITEPARGDLWAPIYLAQTLGYFKEAGLDVDFQTVTGGDPGAPVLVGEAQFGLRGIEMPLIVTQAGKEVKVLVSTSQKFPYAFIAQGPKFTTIESLKGQVVGASTPSGSPTAWIKACLSYGGLDPSTDVQLPSMQNSAYIAAMKNGNVAAVCGSNGYLVNKLMANGGVMLVDGRDTEVFKKIMGSETYEMYIMFATDKYIKENPETVQKVVTACAKGIQWVNMHSTEEIEEALLPLFPDRREELLISIADSKKYDLYSKDGKHTKTGYQAALKLGEYAGIVTQEVPEEKIYNETFLDTAWNTLKNKQ
ncbi:ABC transporter substrate-binding protein [Desulfosporosinus nitroreducens]|uniref:ABC transporter substrate-binding protein n=1 Tax=Desulfosporosinus nitroreducens TaxID=2018668 RepID=A0ABT8QKT5_9FIRM|nr:ABC transporter substrate-binding protein [Desulfosporosinus nitroreducens]MDO0821250.1 ABC transporter substrate-binding protein [Desulfosporosinus nitroreducens]